MDINAVILVYDADARMSEAEYLAYDLEHEGKHEYVNGEVLAMSGASFAHNAIQTNLVVALGNRLRGGPCRVLGADMRVRVDETGLYCYPDVTVVCGAPEFAPTRPESLKNPCVIIEILSDSTENADLGAKAAHYRHRATVDVVLFVDSRRRAIQRQGRNADATWTLSDHDAGVVRVLDHDLALDEIYEGVALAT